MKLIFSGGGTFDVAVVSIDNKFGIYNIRSTNGDTRLGGSNFDTRLVEYCAEDLKRDCLFLESNKKDMVFLRNACEKAKKDLSIKEETDVVIDWLINESYKVTLTRRTYENMIRDYVNRTVECVKRAIEDARLRKEQIDKIVLVGGSTNIPIIRTTLKEFFGMDVNISMNSFEAGI